MSKRKERESFIPIISIQLLYADREISDENLRDMPTFIRKAQFRLHTLVAEGQLSGQPFSVSYPSYWRMPKQENVYARFDFPQQGIVYHSRIEGETGPKFAIVYKNQEPEERGDERLRKLGEVGIYDKNGGRAVIDEDNDVNRSDLTRLRNIGAYFMPTILFLYKFCYGNWIKLYNSEGSGTLESLIVPKG